MNYREAFTKYPLGREQYDGEWVRIWEELGRLLLQSADHRALNSANDMELEALGCLCDCLIDAIQCAKKEPSTKRQVCLLDGTIVKEWGAT